MQKFLIFSLALICLVSARPLFHQLNEYTFDQFIKDYNRTYVKGSEEYLMREKLFNENLKEVRQHNNLYASGQESYNKNINQFSDLTQEEFKSYLGYNKGMKQRAYGKSFLAPQSTVTDEMVKALPASVDWREKGFVSPVRDQQSCGSCWAFASVAVLESHAAIVNGSLYNLSEEQLVACMPNPQQCGGQGGCNGAIAELAMDFVHQNGITTNELYPYASGSGSTQSCRYNAQTMPSKVTIDGYVQLPQNSYNDLMYALATVGPVAISVDASQWSNYNGGVFSGCSYNRNIDIDHAVVAVGYGTDSQLGDYWLVRNSWTSQWGENGYIRVKRDAGSTQCGTDSTPLDGFACAGQNAPIKVCGQCGILSDSVYPTGVRVVA